MSLKLLDTLLALLFIGSLEDLYMHMFLSPPKKCYKKNSQMLQKKKKSDQIKSPKHSSFYSRKEMEKILKRRSKTICKSHQMFGSLETTEEKKNDP